MATADLTVSVTPPSDPGDTAIGAHLWLLVPDVDGGSGASIKLDGSPALDGTATLSADASPIDLGVQYFANGEPWTLYAPFPAGLDPTQTYTARVYAASVSPNTTNPLVREPNAGATPSATFQLGPRTGQVASASAVTLGQVTGLTAQQLPNDSSTGKMYTPWLVLVGTTPSQPPAGWGYMLYYVAPGADLSTAVPVSGVNSQPGPVPPLKTDVVTDVQNTFALQTPTAVQTGTLYAVSGLSVNGVWTPNAIIPGITPSCPLGPFGTDTGTVDAAAIIQASIAAELQIVEGQLGVTPGSLNASKLAPGAAQTNLGVVNAAAIITPLSVVGTLLASTGIITTNSQVGLAVIADANIANCNVSKLQAGTAQFSGTAIFQSGSSGPSVAIASTGISLADGSNQITASASGVTLASSAASATLNSSGLALTAGSYQASLTATSLSLTDGTRTISVGSGAITLQQSATVSVTIASAGVTLTNGIQQVQVTASGIALTNGTQQLQLTASGINLYGNGTHGIEIDTSGNALFTDALGTSTSIQGNSIGCGPIFCASLQLTPGVIAYGPGYPTATGSKTLTGYVEVNVNGTLAWMPYYV